MEKIISEPVKELWSHITGLSSPITSFVRTIIGYIFRANKPDHKQQPPQKNRFLQTIYFVSLGTFLFFAYELLIKPAIEQTALYLWLKNLPTSCYFVFLTFSWPIKIAIGLSILLAIALALNAKATQDHEAMAEEVQAKNLSAQTKKQHDDNIRALVQNHKKLELAVQKLEQDIQNTQTQRAEAKRKHALQLTQKTQLDLLRYRLSLPPLPSTVVKNGQILAEQHALGKLLANKIFENLSSPQQRLTVYHTAFSTRIDNIKNEMQILNAHQTSKAMGHTLNLLNQCYDISIQINQGTYTQAQNQVEIIKTNSTTKMRYSSTPPLLAELEKLLAHLHTTSHSSNTSNDSTRQSKVTTSSASTPDTTTSTDDSATQNDVNSNTVSADENNSTPPPTQTATPDLSSPDAHTQLTHAGFFDSICHATFSHESSCTIC